MIKEQGLTLASRLAVTSLGKTLALPRCGGGGEQQHGDKSSACAGLVRLLPTDQAPWQPGLVEI